MLKGYRNAQTAWWYRRSSSSATDGNVRFNDTTCNIATTLHLLIYAPRRKCTEVWNIHRGMKIASLSNECAPERGLLLQQPALPVRRGGDTVVCGYESNACWMFDMEKLELIDLTSSLVDGIL